jgi:predicted nucleic acid-binding Zn ribbon protein
MAEKIGQILKRFIKKEGLKKKGDLIRFLRLWQEVTDPMVSRVSRPVGFSRGILRVEVDSPALLQELIQFKGSQLLSKLNMLSHKKIHKLKFELSLYERENSI